MIRSFKDKDTEDLYHRRYVRRFSYDVEIVDYH